MSQPSCPLLESRAQEENLDHSDHLDLPDQKEKWVETAWRGWTESRDLRAMFSSFQPTLEQTRDLITNCSPSFPKQCRTLWVPLDPWVSRVSLAPQVLLENLVSRGRREKWGREAQEVQEVWLDPRVLREREADLEEMEREACLDLQDPRESLVYRDFLAWWEPKETEDTREMQVTREMREPVE